ncbi:hypothetical protein KJ657_02725 [Patescibacteria group bacterium]|nr:hypothetical protein [Patescibacteria group bacterium]MBU1015982.1 hypothetical protein [Patescibacteria group bacterium]MBU1684809.1 hypothetical protein [Patescibacteria group bacterium]MBU1938779.1 hypothetical protein [Patescibacteria group bacterium]
MNHIFTMGNQETPQQRDLHELAKNDPNQIMMRQMGLEDIRVRRIEGSRAEYDAKIDGEGYQLIFTKRGDEVEVLAIRHSDSEMFSEMIDDEMELHMKRERVDEILKKAPEKKLREVAESIGMTTAEIDKIDKKKLKEGIRRGIEYILDDRAGRGDAEVNLNKAAKILGIAFGSRLEMALRSVCLQINDKHFDEKADAAFKKAEAMAKKPTTAEVVKEVVTNQIAPQVALLALSGLIPGAVAPEPDDADLNTRLPKQSANAQQATERNKAVKEAEEQAKGWQFSRGLEATAKLQQNWSWEHVSQIDPGKTQDSVTDVMKKHGLENIRIEYTPEAMKVYHFTYRNRSVEFTILPGGTITYTVLAEMPPIIERALGFAIAIADFRKGDFQADSLEDAIVKVKGITGLPLDEGKKFIYTDISGMQPLDVTSNRELQEYALPYPVVVTNLPTQGPGIAMPMEPGQFRAFQYIPLSPRALVPIVTPFKWYKIGKEQEKRVTEAGEQPEKPKPDTRYYSAR